jgi:hypothetical protein
MPGGAFQRFAVTRRPVFVLSGSPKLPLFRRRPFASAMAASLPYPQECGDAVPRFYPHFFSQRLWSFVNSYEEDLGMDLVDCPNTLAKRKKL